LIDRRLLRNFDWLFFADILLLLAIGVAMIYSGTHQKAGAYYALRQGLWVVLGLGFLLLVTFLDYRRSAQYAYVFYALVILLLVYVNLHGVKIMGARRWIRVGPVSFQPSEFAKVALVLVLAHYLEGAKDRLANFRVFLTPFLFALPLMLLVMKQPDLGTALMFLPIALVMVFAAGARKNHIVAVVLAGIAMSPFAWKIMKPYQRARILVFLDPGRDPMGAGYSVVQSKIAIGSGGLLGKGWLHGSQTQLEFLPEKHTDFIFALIGEELGFVGALLVLTLFGLMIARAIRITYRAKDSLGQLIAVGFTTMLLIHVFVNIGMTMGIMPVVGLPLPFISYGGSALLVNMIGCGFILNVGMRKFMY